VWHGSSRVEEPREVTLETWHFHRPPDIVMRAPISWAPRALSRIRRGDEFAHVVAATVSYLKGQWPQELKPSESMLWECLTTCKSTGSLASV
jgi:hypothetical protein